MKAYINTSTDPYFNLAAEQYLLDTEDGEIFMLWRNDKAVIIGRNQNAYAEIDRAFVKEHDIAVVRRLTGGGAVFHDLGNVNFTFISPKRDDDLLDFSHFCAPVVTALRKLGVPAELSGRNDMTVNGRKFSGNAACVYNGKSMHHGTLLFSADVSEIEGSLHVDPEKMQSKGIKSVRSRVCNLKEYLPDLDVTGFFNYLISEIAPDASYFSDEQIKGIQKLKDEKYGTWEWNYGVSKQYAKTAKKRYPFGSVEISYTAENGILSDVKISGDYFGTSPTKELENRLKGCRLSYGELCGALSGADEFISGASPEQITDLFMM
ncbi:MAG: lipoate--protein ligase [Clostridia bacterium]|nr:lipoate--protein ligase [Clostridia bacterium]